MDKNIVEENFRLLKKQIPSISSLHKKEEDFFEKKETLHISYQTNVLCVVGLNPYVFSSLKKWLEKKDHYLIFLESDLLAFSHLLYEKDAKELLSHRRVSCKYIESYLHIEKLLKEIAWEYVFLEAKLHILPSYKKREKHLFHPIASHFERVFTGVHLSASEFSDFGLDSTRNMYQNLMHIPSICPLRDLQNCLKNVPAIICGAGPSLDQQKKDLKKVQDKALIFSGGSALRCLENIDVHFLGCVDKDTPKEFYEKKNLEKSILFYLWKTPLDIIQRPFKKKILCAQKQSYLLERWMKEELDFFIDGIDLGWTVTTALTSLAVYLGCDPLIFVGVDLGFLGDKIYAENVSNASYQQKETQNFIKGKTKDGKWIRTQKDWQMAAFFLQELSNHSGRTFYNTSKAGLDLGEGVKPFQIKEMHNWKRYDFQSMLTLFEKQEEIPIDPRRLQKLLKMFDGEMQKCEKMLKDLEAYWSGKVHNLKEWEDSWCQKNMLKFLWDIWKHPLLRHEKKDEAFFFKEKVHQSLFYKDILCQHKKLLTESLHD